MDGYTVRYGRHEGPPAEDYQDLLNLPCEAGKDDGKIQVYVGGEPHPCPDCGGDLRWAEAGYVSWHRICDRCGSHWDLHPVTWGPMLRSAQGRFLPPEAGLLRWEQGVGAVPLDPDEPLPGTGDLPHPPTWGDLVALIRPEHWEEALQQVGMMAGDAVVPGAWVCRARFY